MRKPLLIIIATAAGLGACVPLPGDPYGYGYAPAAAPVGYYGGGYAPGPYIAEPGYAPYASPGPTIIVGGERRFDGGERRFDGGDRYRYERSRNEGAYRGNPYQRQERNSPPPPRQAQQNFGGGRPGPAPVAARPGPGPGPQGVPPPPAGGAAFEQWNRTHVNASGGSENNPR